MVLLLLPALALGALAADVPEPSEDFYVYDGAGTLSQSTKDLIINASGPLEKYCSGAQIVVVTIDYLPSGYDSEQYANLLFNEWGVGSSQLNNGLLLLHVVMEDRGWLAVGAGLTTQFSTDYVNSLMDEYFWPYSDSGEYDKAVATLFPHLIDEFARIYNTDQLYGGTGGATGGNQGGGYYDDGYYDGGYYDDGWSFHLCSADGQQLWPQALLQELRRVAHVLFLRRTGAQRSQRPASPARPRPRRRRFPRRRLRRRRVLRRRLRRRWLRRRRLLRRRWRRKKISITANQNPGGPEPSRVCSFLSCAYATVR